MRRVFVFLLLLQASVICAQHNFGMRAGAGASLLTTVFNPTDQELHQSFWPRATGSVGLFYSYSFGNRWMLLVDPNYFYMRGKETMKNEAVDINGPTGTYVYDTLLRNFHTLALPIQVGISFGKWSYLLGVQGNYYFYRNGSECGSWTEPNGVFHSWSNEYSEDQYGTDVYDYGLTGGVMYSYSNKLSFDVRAFAGLNNLVQGNIADYWKWKVYLLTFGVNYSLYKSPPHVVPL